MIRRLLHRMLANPVAYDLAQLLSGVRYVQHRLAAQIAPVGEPTYILDLGGGTGINRRLWSPECRYICLDTDPLKLAGFVRKNPRDIPLLGDATRVPIATAAVDVVLCTAVSHHLPDALLPALLGEVGRCLKPGGRFIFLDAVWESTWLPGRLLWRYDQGSYPHTKSVLRAEIARHCAIARWEEFRVFHCYVLCVGVKGAGVTGEDAGTAISA